MLVYANDAVFVWRQASSAPAIPPTGTAAPRARWQLLTQDTFAVVFLSYGSPASTVTSVTSDSSLAWITRTSTQRDLSISWTTRAAVQQDRTLAWDILSGFQVTSDVTLTWSMDGSLQSVESDSLLSWITRSSTQRDRTLSWSVSTSSAPPRIRLKVKFTQMPSFTSRTVR